MQPNPQQILLNDGIPGNGSDNDKNNEDEDNDKDNADDNNNADDDLQEIVDGVLQIEEEVSPGLVRPAWENIIMLASKSNLRI